jgi:DNA-binding CsgD family transcriptional regulator
VPGADASIADLAARVERACAAAQVDDLGLDGLDALSEETRAILRGRALSPRVAGALAAMLGRLGAAHGRAVQHAARERARGLAEVHDQLDRLRRCRCAEDLVRSAPAAALACCDADRAFLSAVRRSSWSVLAVAVAGPGARELELALREVRFPLGEHVERDVVRRRRAALVAPEDPAVNPVFARVTGSRGYAAAPVCPARRHAELLLHLDRAPARGALGDVACDRLAAFADGLGLQLASVRAHWALQKQHARLRTSLAAAARRSDELASAPIVLDFAPREPLDRTSRAPARLPLSPRELEVVELMACGLRNAQIAGQLVLSEATIKGHVTAIMRKLHAGSRGEAVARYLRLIQAADRR